MSPHESRRGLSMAEAIIAMFVLLGGFTVIFRLFHTAMQYSNVIDAQQQKVRVAQNKLEEIRAWSRVNHQPAGPTPFTDWTHWHNLSGRDSEYPAIDWKVTVRNAPLSSPCSLFEKAETVVDRRRLMPDSCKQITVEANTGLGSHGVTLTTLIGQPATAELCQIELGTVGALNIKHNQHVDFTAKLQTVSARVILDMFYHWTVNSSLASGNGTFSGPRTGRSATLTHVIHVRPGLDVYCVPGPCRAHAVCTYRGKVYVETSPVISLED